MAEVNEKIVEQFENIKSLVEQTEVEVMKNAKGNASAGNRARKGLRQLKREAAELVKLTIAEEKRRKEEKQ